jgi:hypothetical protein
MKTEYYGIFAIAAAVAAVLYYFWKHQTSSSAANKELYITRGSVSEGGANYGLDQEIAAVVRGQATQVPTSTVELGWNL